VHSVGYITRKKKKKTNKKLSWVEKQRERDENIIAEMERDTELRKRERGIRDLGVERVGAFGQKTNFYLFPRERNRYSSPF
jgi:hypothetical protein